MIFQEKKQYYQMKDELTEGRNPSYRTSIFCNSSQGLLRLKAPFSVVRG